jgi:hypothetical protein
MLKYDQVEIVISKVAPTLRISFRTRLLRTVVMRLGMSLPSCENPTGNRPGF